jgi:hypothetical protein
MKYSARQFLQSIVITNRVNLTRTFAFAGMVLLVSTTLKAQQPPFPNAPGAPFVNGVATGHTDFVNKNSFPVARINWQVTWIPPSGSFAQLRTQGTIVNSSSCNIAMQGMFTGFWDNLFGTTSGNLLLNGSATRVYSVPAGQNLSFDLSDVVIDTQKQLLWLEQVGPNVEQMAFPFNRYFVPAPRSRFKELARIP